MSQPTCHIGVRFKDEGDEAVRQIAFVPGIPLRDILNSSSLQVRSACVGIGACGLCRVRIDSGSGGPPTTAELLHLGEEAVAAGERLACQVVPTTSLDVTVLLHARPSLWRTPFLPPYHPAYALAPAPEGASRLGVAIDLGTTHITLGICDLVTGRRIAVRTGPNPQAGLCSDVIGRLHMASLSQDGSQSMQTLVEDAIHNGLMELSRSEGLPLASVASLRIAGNSAMLLLLSGADPTPLLDPKGWNETYDPGRFSHPDLTTILGLAPTADVALVPALGGFVGSDLALGALHCRFTERTKAAALIDFGTNSEIGLWDGQRLWVTAAAGGPAFEGVGIGCGMSAEPGAVHRLTSLEDGRWLAEVIEGGEPLGICGSGMVDLVAHLLQRGDLDKRGRPQTTPIEIPIDDRRFHVSKNDIDMLQRAKAAISAGLETLCHRAGIPLSELDEIYVAGAFGDHLNLDNAIQIGLLPSLPIDRFRLVGNSSLSGALDIILSPDAAAALTRLQGKTTVVNLSMDENFDDLFIDHLHLQAFTGGQVR